MHKLRRLSTSVIGRCGRSAVLFGVAMVMPLAGSLVLVGILQKAAEAQSAQASQSAATAPAADDVSPATLPVDLPPPPPAKSAQIRAWFDQLADPDAVVREQAHQSLMLIKRAQLPALRQVAQERLPLAPSQATVLRQIVRQVYLAGELYEVGLPTGFLGIQMSDTALSFPDPQSPDAKTPPGVVIDFRMTGFCAAASLRDGDAILEIAERPQAVLRTSFDLKAVVGDLEPGHLYHFFVLRDGRIQNIPIVLDARPADPELLVHGSNENDQRRLKADDYWEKNFAPLLKTVS